jgi:branched-subunit amino acid aminotransferase/4-amino-4-deoxychorismate lyase
MACVLRQVGLDGHADDERPAPFAAESLRDAAEYEPDDGVYAVFATWNGHRVVCLSRHLDRLEDSARRAGFALSLDRPRLRGQLRHILAESGYAEARIRVSAAPASDYLTVAMEPYAGPPLELRRSGVRCGTVAHDARDNPEAKRTNWLHERSTFPAADEGGVYEQLLVDDQGRLLEGASSNFYVVMEQADGRHLLRTAETGILPGIARAIVLDVAPGIIEVVLQAPRITELDRAREAFITSASRGIVPVTHLDGVRIGSGTPGEFTRRLTEAYDARALELEEPL